jgi:hypothetical protein
MIDVWSSGYTPADLAAGLGAGLLALIDNHRAVQHES